MKYAFRASLSSGSIIVQAFDVLDAPDLQRAPYGWTVRWGDDPPITISLSGEPAVLTPVPHQPEWGKTAEEAREKLTKQILQRVRLAGTLSSRCDALVYDYDLILSRAQ